MPLIEKLFGAKKPNNERTFSALKKISKLSDEINKKTKEMAGQEYSLIIEKKDDYYLSLADFLDLMNKKDLSIKDIGDRCTHITELKNKVAVVEVYAISEGNHIVLCSDTKKCEKHKDYVGDKIKIVSIKVKRNNG